MVRVNLLDPKFLADQHLVAEYNEILMIAGHFRKHGVKIKEIPNEYCLGKGHMNFFKNKFRYLEKRHKIIKKEMLRREFRASKSLDVSSFLSFYNDWIPRKKDFQIIRERIIEKIKLKPDFYRYYGRSVGGKFLVKLVQRANLKTSHSLTFYCPDGGVVNATDC